MYLQCLYRYADIFLLVENSSRFTQKRKKMTGRRWRPLPTGHLERRSVPLLRQRIQKWLPGPSGTFPADPTRLPLEQKDHRGYEDKVRLAELGEVFSRAETEEELWGGDKTHWTRGALDRDTKTLTLMWGNTVNNKWPNVMRDQIDFNSFDKLFVLNYFELQYYTYKKHSYSINF